MTEISKKSLAQRIRSLETWERADWFMRYKSPTEVWGGRYLKTDDLLPICLGFLRVLLVSMPLLYLNIVLWSANKIAFYILIGLTIPIALVLHYCMNYLIKKYIVKDNET